MIGPPWIPPSPAWAIDGVRINIRTPDTPRLVGALLASDESGASGMLVVSEYCATPADWMRVIELALPSGSPLTFARLHLVADRIIESHLGMTRWRATRIWGQAISMWPEVEGEIRLAGTDVMALDARSATNVVYALLRKWVQPESREKWQRELDREPYREVQRLIEEEVPDEEPGQFEMMMELDRKRRKAKKARPEGSGGRITMP